MQNLIDLLLDIKENGVDKPDRTGIGSRAVFGRMLRWDLADGFPMQTTRKVPLRIAFEETMFFLRGETQTKLLEAKNINIWKGNTSREFLDKRGLNHLPSGSLGYGYSHQWRNFDGFAKIPPGIDTPFPKDIIVDTPSDVHGYVGKEFTSNSCGQYTVIREIRSNGSKLFFDVKFHKTGYVTNVRKQNIDKGQIYDPYFPNVAGVACSGDTTVKNTHPDLWKKLRPMWDAMISRCYDTKDHSYPGYGGKNIYVSARWLLFSNFVIDAQTLPGWNKKLVNWKKYSLDKDIAAKGYYSEKTCQWVDLKTQLLHSSIFIPEKSTEHLGVDQIADLLSGIQKDPYGRRHVVTGWNPGQLHEMALPPCHMLHMYSVEGDFTVNNGKLNNCFVMRSNDVPFGLPFNIASYALLNHIFAKYLKMEPGELVYFGWDVHVYQNQLEMVDEILERTPRALPTLKINKELNTFDDILALQWEDIELIGYDPYPDVKNKPGMAV
jgi:thymidylate synthase